MERPHDKFFKESLSNQETVRDFLENYLPQNLLEKIDLDSVEIIKDSFIDQELEEYFSDTVYRADLADKEAYLCFLFEHKSYPYPQITLQLLKYMLKIWELEYKQTEELKLPLIIPILIYHGQREWNIGLRLSDIVEEIPEGLEAYLPDFKYLLYDLSSYSKEEIKGTGQLKIFLEVLSSLFQDDFEERLIEALKVLKRLEEQNKAVDYFETVIRYIINAKDGLEIDDLRRIASKISAGKEEEVMTIAEKLKEEGREEGREEGKLVVAKKMLKENESIEKISKYTKLSKEKLKEIRKNIQQ